MKSIVQREHQNVCDRVSAFFQSRGGTVFQEVGLPRGRGAVDVAVHGYDPKSLYIEVKSHPMSIRQGGLQEQLRRHEETFPDQRYLLAFPIDGKTIVLCDFKTGQRQEITA